MHIDHVPIELMFSCKSFVAFLAHKLAIILVRVTQQMRRQCPFFVEAPRAHIAPTPNIRLQRIRLIFNALFERSQYSRERIRVDVPADMV